MKDAEKPDQRQAGGLLAKVRRALSHPAVFIPAVLLSLGFGVLALWLRLTNPGALTALYDSTQLDLRLGAFAFGIGGAIGAAFDPRSEYGSVRGVRLLALCAGATGALLGVGLLAFGLISALLG